MMNKKMILVCAAAGVLSCIAVTALVSNQDIKSNTSHVPGSMTIQKPTKSSPYDGQDGQDGKGYEDGGNGGDGASGPTPGNGGNGGSAQFGRGGNGGNGGDAT